MSKSKEKAIQAINKKGILLVYPIKNSKEPQSIWSELYPRSEMKWDWNEDSDNRVAQLWFLREQLSTSGEVVYTKWYQNRATFMSKKTFIDLLSFYQTADEASAPSSPDARNILENLEQDSPVSTKQIKEAAELQGRFLEAKYNRAMKVLWQKLYIVAFGEVQDSSFPSLAVGSSKVLFEDLWLQSLKQGSATAQKSLLKTLGADNKFYQFALKIKKLM